MILEVSENTLRNWDASGRFHAQRHPLNNYRLYRESDVMKLRKKILLSKGNKYDDAPPISHKTDSFSSIVKQLNRTYRNNDMDLMTRFEEISKILFCSFMDDELGRTDEKWERKFILKPDDSKDAVFRRISKLYTDTLPESIDSKGGIRPASNAVYEAVRLLQAMDLAKYDEDVKGTTYEEMIRHTFEGDENQQYFTPRPLVHFMVELANPQASDTVCDPACGTGGFIVETLKKISRDLKLEGAAEPEKILKQFSRHRLTGIEVDSRVAWTAKMNCYTHGGSPDSIHHLVKGGSLAFDNGSQDLIPDESFEVVITNPPFGSDFTDEKNLRHYKSAKDRKSARRGVLFVERCLRILKRGGRMAIIVDDSILNSSSNNPIRDVILNQSIVLAVVSLPDDMFKPYASVKSSILFLRKRHSSSETQPPVFFANLKSVGRKPNGAPQFTDERNPDGTFRLMSDFPEALEKWQQYQLGKPLKHTGESQYFIAQLDSSPANPSLRLDSAFHDPSKEIAKRALETSPYSIYPLSTLFRIRNESIVPAKTHSDDEISYLSLADIEKETGEYTLRRVKGIKIKSGVRRFEAGDILFAKMRPQLRKVVLVDEEGYCSSECLVLESRFEKRGRIEQVTLDPYTGDLPSEYDSPDVRTEFVNIVLRSNLVFGQIMPHVTGIGRPRVPVRAVMKVRIPIPPIKIQDSLIRQFRQKKDTSMMFYSQAQQMMKEASQMNRSAHEEIVESLGVQNQGLKPL